MDLSSLLDFESRSASFHLCCMIFVRSLRKRPSENAPEFVIVFVIVFLVLDEGLGELLFWNYEERFACILAT